MGNAASAATAGQSALLKLEISGPVLTVGLNRPAKRNAVNLAAMDALWHRAANGRPYALVLLDAAIAASRSFRSAPESGTSARVTARAAPSQPARTRRRSE